MTPRHLKRCVRCGTLPRVHWSGAPGICNGYLEPATVAVRLANAVVGGLLRVVAR